MNPKLARILARFAASAAMSLLALSAARADPISNGDFSAPTDLAGWTAEFTIVGEPTHNYAQLATDGEPRRTLSQTFALPTQSATLGFDFAFHTSASSINDIPVGTYPDSLAASLITAGGDFLDILVVDLAGADAYPSANREWATGALPIVVDLDPSITIPDFPLFFTGSAYSGHITVWLPDAILGQDATLYFDLYDQSDNASTIAGIDNVALQPTYAAPVPATFGLLLVGMAAGATARRKGKATGNPRARGARLLGFIQRRQGWG